MPVSTTPSSSTSGPTTADSDANPVNELAQSVESTANASETGAAQSGDGGSIAAEASSADAPAPEINYSPDELLGLIIEKLSAWIESGVAMIPNLLLASVLLIIFFVVGSYIKKALEQVFGKVFDSSAVSSLLAAIGKIVFICFGFFFALDLLGLQKAVFSLLAGAGIIGLAIGFAFQDLAENFLAGLMLGVRKPFEPGDLIRSNDQYGTVERLNLRNTIIRDFNGQIIYIPNKEVFKNVLENYSQSGRRRIVLGVGVSYGENLDHVEDTLRSALEQLSFRANDSDVDVWALEFGDSSINFSVRYWIDYPDGEVGYFKAIHLGVKAIKDAFDDEGIVIPFPIRTLDFGIKGGQNLAEPMGEILEMKTTNQD